MKNIFRIFFISILLFTCSYGKKQYFLSINETPKYKQNFPHFEYVNPKAPKGGSLKMAVQGTYDSFNIFTLKGHSASGIGLLYDSLMVGSGDENSVYYPLLAQAVEVDEGNKWVRFFINKKARFHDGLPVKAKDVKFTFDTLMSKGSPIYKRYYQDVKEAIVESEYVVKFTFKKDNNKELPLILSQLSIFPEHFWKNKDFLDSDGIVPMGSGAYRVKKYEFGKYIVLERDKDYWAKSLNVNLGQYNFDEIWYDYYKDKSIILEAFKSGNIDFIYENTAKNWATLYKGKNFDNGNIVKEEIHHEMAQGMQGFVYNLRNPLFKNRNVRRALNLAFDFEWINKKLFYSQYKRTSSYFDNSYLKALNKPSKEELVLLERFKSSLPKEVFGDAYKPHVTKGDGNIRKELREALRILKKEGWKFKDKVLQKDGRKFSFEILLGSNSFEKVINPFIQNLKKIGIKASIRVIDQVAYMNKVQNFDFDMIVATYGVSLSPGNELRNYWGSKSASIKGSRNYMGLQSKPVDFLIEKVVTARSSKELTTAVKALDRVLTFGYYVIPNWHINTFRVAYWNKLKKPKISPKYDLGLFTWWIDKR